MEDRPEQTIIAVSDFQRAAQALAMTTFAP